MIIIMYTMLVRQGYKRGYIKMNNIFALMLKLMHNNG